MGRVAATRLRHGAERAISGAPGTVPLFRRTVLRRPE